MSLSTQSPSASELGDTPGLWNSTGGSTARRILTRRSLRYALAVLWLLDGALQLQSFMFTKGFAHLVIAPAGSGQPFFVADPVRWNASLIGQHPVLLNSLFAAIQLSLGLGFLFERTARVAIVGSVVWAGGVWFLGEGLGGLASGHVTALLGAPGAALLYIPLAMASWPDRAGSSTVGATLPSARPPRWILGVWALLWVGSALLSILPGNTSPSTAIAQLNANSSAVPQWLGHVDTRTAHVLHTLGVTATVMVALVEIAIGLLALSQGKLRVIALGSGIVLAGLYWALGQSFGELFSGQATDPSTGPLVVVLALAALGAGRGMVRTRPSTSMDLCALPLTPSQNGHRNQGLEGVIA